MQRRRRIAAITMGEKMRKVDLHIHSTASDGTWTPQELVNAAQAAGLGLIAVTDHDSTANVLETMRIAAANGIKCLPGVEVCATKDACRFIFWVTALIRTISLCRNCWRIIRIFWRKKTTTAFSF